jgi:ferric-dicitrate binding protein FerR (iron transport regulator)
MGFIMHTTVLRPYLFHADASIVAARKLVRTARRKLTPDLVTAVSAIVVMVAMPVRRNASAVGTDKGERRTCVLGAESLVLVGTVNAVVVPVANHE